MIPILFEKSETLFANNGLCRLRDCVSCVVKEERNGLYECDFTYPITGANFEEIQCGRIIGVTHDDTGDLQPFDIVSYTKPIDGIVTFHAVHVSYRLKGLVCTGTNINSLASALAALETATPSSPFTYEADFSPSGYASAFDGVPRSVRQLLGGVQGSILDTYGGEYEWNKFKVILHRSRGDVLDFSIRYGVNMLDYNEDVDFADTYTSAVPYWIGDDGTGVQTLVTGNKVSSGLTPFNDIEKCVPLDLSDKFENAPTTAELEALALSMMMSKKVNFPKQTINVDFVRLSDFNEYANFQSLMKCKLCDQVEVIFPEYNMGGFFKIVRTEYDVLMERFKTMELGSLSTTLSEALGIGDASGTSSGGGGGGSAIYYGICSTAGSTPAKTVTVAPNVSALSEGLLVFIKFDNANTVSNPTLNVNGLGAKNIYRYGSTAPSTSAASSWNAGSICALMYDGSAWQMVGWINTTYSSMTQAEIEAGTGTTARIITPARLKYAIDYWGGGGSGVRSSFYGTCSTASATAQKDVTCSGWTLAAGNTISILFDNSNTANVPTLNINSTGAKNIYRGNTQANGTNSVKWSFNTICTFIYDGTQYRYLSSMPNYSYAKIEGGGGFYGTCATQEATTTKAVTVGTYDFSIGSILAVYFTYENTLADSLYITVDNGTTFGISKDGANVTSSNPLTWSAGDTLYFMFRASGPTYKFEYLGSTDGNVPIATSNTYGTVMVEGYYDPPGGYAEITTGNNPSVVSLPILESVGGVSLMRAKFLPDASTSTKGAMSATDKTKLDGIPDVTSADNGKVMRVVNGAWSAVLLPSASGVSF